MNTAVYLMNRMPTKALKGGNPYKALMGKEPTLHHIKLFGCRAFTHIYDNERQKFDGKARKGIFIGYDPFNSRCYRIYDRAKDKVIQSVHVTFDERT